MEFIWILFAFACGLGVKLLSMPPLIGYLAAGFALNFLGFEPSASLDHLADLGITLMLFTIGLKLDPRLLLQTEVWGGTLGHMSAWMLVSGASLLLLSLLSVSIFANLDLATVALLAFACSFSSTVCVVKLLEENGEMKTRHGRVAVAILVMQDIVAVVFLVFATNKAPSLYTPLLLLLIPARPLLHRLLQKAGHGELLPLTGFFLALGGYELFQLFNIKGDLGALIIGMLLSSYSKSAELSKSLLSFKDLFLIGFFLSIGFADLPDWSMLWSAALLCLLLLAKFALFFFLLTGLKLRARSAYLSALALSNFSEFGLIVAAISVDGGWLHERWLVTLAVAVSLSFILTSLLYRQAHARYQRFTHWFKRFERPERLPQDVVELPHRAEILIIGMGRVGRGAFDALQDVVGDAVWGMDADRQRIERQLEHDLHVFCADGEDADFWQNIDTSDLKMILLSLPTVEDALNTAYQIRAINYSGMIAAIARYEDDRRQLLDAGIDKVFNFFTEAGTGFAEESLSAIGWEMDMSEAAPTPYRQA